MPTTKILVTTRDHIKGKTVSEELGIVHGNVAKSRNFFRDFLAGIRDFLGQEVKEYTEMLRDTREESMKRMIKAAEDLGANAILSIRFMTSEIKGGVSELMVYGTAVKLK